MKNIAIVGAGGLGKDVAMMLEHINKVSEVWNILGFYDDDESLPATVYGYPVFGKVSKLNAIDEELAVVVAIGDPSIKKRVYRAIANHRLWYPFLIHPGVSLPKSPHVQVGDGTLIMQGAIIAVDANIGHHVLIHNSSILGHDSKVGDFCSLMPGVNISGETVLGESVYLGTGAIVINRLSIGNNTIVGAGAVVAEDIPANCTAVGVPARPIKFHYATPLSA